MLRKFGRTEATGYFIVSDIDETLLNSAIKHFIWLTIFGQLFREENLPTYADFLTLGGSHAAYQKYDWYPKINEAMCQSEVFNTGLTPIPGAQEAIATLSPLLYKYLTTRPDNTTETSKQDLLRNGFPDRVVTCRPEGIPISKTTEWKIADLTQLAEKTGAHIFMVDDSVNLYNALCQLGHPLISGILIKGPTTHHPEARSWPEIFDFLQLFL